MRGLGVELFVLAQMLGDLWLYFGILLYDKSPYTPMGV